MSKELPRGIRNNNPGNIEISKEKWQGKLPLPQNTDGRFEQFVSAVKGIRAIEKDLMTGEKRGEDTVREIINAWAPPGENDTGSYVAFVCRRIGVTADTIIDVDDYAVAFKLVTAIIDKENGEPSAYGRKTWYTDEEMRAALFDAGVHDAPQAEPTTTVEAKGAAGAGLSGLGVTGIETIYDNLNKLEPIKQTLIDISPAVSIAKYVLLAITVVGAVMVMYGLVQKLRKGII